MLYSTQSPERYSGFETVLYSSAFSKALLHTSLHLGEKVQAFSFTLRGYLRVKDIKGIFRTTHQ